VSVSDRRSITRPTARTDQGNKRSPIPATARELMTTNVITISAESSAHEAARIQSDNPVSGLPVLSMDGSIVRVLSVYDLLAKLGATVNEVMSCEVTTVGDTAALSSVRAVLAPQHYEAGTLRRCRESLGGDHQPG
jgi:predicted transcriptional regulator